MPKSNQIMGKQGLGKKTVADLTQDFSALAAKVLGDPSTFPDTFTAWIPRWIMQNPNFQITQAQLPANGSIHVIGGSGEIAVFKNLWAYFGANSVPSYYKDPFTRVFLNGIVAGGTVSTGPTGVITTLPAGFRPQYKQFFAVPSNGAFGLCTVDVNGDVKAEIGSNVYFALDGISFRQYA